MDDESPHDRAEYSGFDIETFARRFQDEGGDPDDPPEFALAEVVKHVKMTDDEVADLFGEELGFSWAELKRMPGAAWRRTVALVRTALCDGGRPKPWAAAAAGAGSKHLAASVVAHLALDPAGGAALLVAMVAAVVGAQGVAKYCAGGSKTSG